MSHLLDFRPSGPLPHCVNAPPYVVFGICGISIANSLPPFIPLRLVLHFAPALRQWVLPAPDPAYLPHIEAEQSLRTPYIGIDILAPVDVVGLGWIIIRMMHLSGCQLRSESFGVHPDLTTSLAIHHTWLALELPSEGLHGLHMHIQAQLMMNSSVRLWDMRILWETFPPESAIVRAMGMNFIDALVGLEYKVHESLEILTWLQSTPELFAWFKSLQGAIPAFLDGTSDAVNTLTAAGDEGKADRTGYESGGRKRGKALKTLASQDVPIVIKHVDIMERGTTRKVSPQERQERETSDFHAMQSRLRRTKSDDSLRSVNTAIWDPQEVEEVVAVDEEEDRTSVNDDMHDPGNYSGGSFSVELARSLESIKLRREARNLKKKSSTDVLDEERTVAAREEYNVKSQPVSKHRSRMSLHRRSSSTSTRREQLIASITDVEKRIKNLKGRQKGSTRSTEQTTVNGAVASTTELRRPELRRRASRIARADAGSDDEDGK